MVKSWYDKGDYDIKWYYFYDNVSLVSVNLRFWMTFLSCVRLVRFIMASSILRISHVNCDDEKHNFLHTPHLVLQHMKSFKQKATAFLVQFFMLCPSVTATATAEVSVLHSVVVMLSHSHYHTPLLPILLGQCFCLAEISCFDRGLLLVWWKVITLIMIFKCGCFTS